MRAKHPGFESGVSAGALEPRPDEAGRAAAQRGVQRDALRAVAAHVVLQRRLVPLAAQAHHLHSVLH